MAKGLTLTYEQCVQAIAEAVVSDGSEARSLALTSAAYALSLARAKGVAEVTADIRQAMETLP